MISNIEYVYAHNDEGEKILLGVKVYFFDGNRINVREIYVGLPFVLEDILENEVNASLLKITDRDNFERKFNELKASGIVYFPQTDRYAFLQKGDKVILWNGNDKIQLLLEYAIDELYREYNNEKEREMSKKLKYLKELDPSDPLIELYDVRRVRKQHSYR